MDATAQPTAKSFSEQLQKMSIFEMLGVQGTEEEKEAFLSEVQDVIWQDVVENDLAPLLTESELDEVQAMLNNEATPEDEKRDYLFDMILKKVPNAEEVLLERTMQLKSDLLHERLHGMQQFFVNNPDALAKLEVAHGHIDAEQHDEAVVVLNELSASIPQQ
jgi:hypothetical protein